MSEDYSQRAFEFSGERYQMVKTERGTHSCEVCEASGLVCSSPCQETGRASCAEINVRDGWHYVKVPKLPLHDGHYRTLEAKGTEPIEHMEALVCRGISEDLHRIAKRNLNMAMASKHQDRAGEKSGEAWEKELQKAENYLHRAWSGRWI